MIKLYTDEEFKLSKSYDKLKLKCEKCEEIIIKEKRVIKYGLKKYEGRQNDLCKTCFFENKKKISKEICGNCSVEFSYVKSNRKKSKVKLCSKKCRNEYLYKCNKEKRELINSKNRLYLKIKRWSNEGVFCKNCNVEFCNYIGKKKYCSDECCKIYMGNIFKTDEHREKMSKLLKGRSGGIRDGGGFTKVYLYKNINSEEMKLNKSEIEIAKALDNLKLNWNRNKIGFKYLNLKGEYRKYYPDFYVKDFNIFVEYKGFVTDEMSHKMKDSVDRNNFDLLIIYSNDKRYKELGLNDEQVKSDNMSIVENIKKIKEKKEK